MAEHDFGLRCDTPTVTGDGLRRTATAGMLGGAATALGSAVLQRKLLQRRARRAAAVEGGPDAMHAAAQEGLSGSAQDLPYRDRIQKSFGGFNVSPIRAFVGGPARAAAAELGAEAYATGDAVAFQSAPDLHTAAHEAAHVVQQRGGVHLSGGVGQAGDAHEQHADHVADLVVQGKSAESLLSRYSRQATAGRATIQRKCGCGKQTASGDECPACKAKKKNQQSGSPTAVLPGRAALRNSLPDKGAADAALQHKPTGTALQFKPVCDDQGVCHDEYPSEAQDGGTPEPADAGTSASDAGTSADPSPQDAGPIAGVVLKPPGNCTQDKWYALQQVVRQECKVSMPRACEEGDSPEVIEQKKAQFQRCIDARVNLDNTCFGGGDSGHNIEVTNLTNGMRNCEQLRVPVPVPQPQEEPQTDSDKSSVWEFLAVLGLGVATILVVISALADPEPSSKLALAGLSTAMIRLILKRFGKAPPEEG